MRRTETRIERYKNKAPHAVSYPIHLACVNFIHESNVGSMIRLAGCFGAKSVMVIGSMPSRRDILSLTGSLFDFVKTEVFKSPYTFLEHIRANDIKLISLENTNAATSIEEYEFNFSKQICIVAGHEETGVPSEIITASDVIYIPLSGVGMWLNTSQAANIALYEAVKRFNAAKKGG
jgi:23S rRNA (guanosine2251-2'-O)-methyltransferase